MDESKESSEDCSLVKSRSDWIVRSWNVRASFAFSLVTGIVAFLWLFTLTGEQLFGIAVGIVTAFFSFWILTIFCMRQFLILLSICLGVIAALLVLSITGWNLFATVVGLVTFAASLSAIVLYKRESRASQLSGMKAVRIETQSISAGAVRKLTGVGHLRFVGCTFDSESASAITEVSSSWLLLDKCKFPNDFEIPSTLSCERHVRRLDLVNTHIQPDLVVQWLSAAKVNRVFLPRPTDKTTEQQLTSQLGTFQDLQSAFISLNAQGAPHLEPIQPKR